MKNTYGFSITVVGVVLLASLNACLPARLQKYRRDGAGNSSGSSSSGGGGLFSFDSGPDAAGSSTMAAKSKAIQPGNSSDANNGNSAPARATIYAVDGQTYRFALRENDVWDSAINVLLHNYNLTIVDRQSGIVTTEWDSYYLENAVYRNRLSLKVSKSSGNTVDVMIHNNVERLRDAAQATGSVGAVWLPADDGPNEVARVVQNMALLLNQPPPVMPPSGQIAKGAQAGPAGYKR